MTNSLTYIIYRLRQHSLTEPLTHSLTHPLSTHSLTEHIYTLPLYTPSLRHTHIFSTLLTQIKSLTVALTHTHLQVCMHT